MQDTQSTQNQTQSISTPQLTNNSPTIQVSPQSTPKTKKPWLLIFIIVLLIGATGILGYKYYELKQQVDNLQQSIPSPSQKLSVSSPPPPTSTPPNPKMVATGKTCKSVNLGISVVMPNKSWTCQVDNLGTEQAGQNGIITAKSSLFDITISSLGRGPYCYPLNRNPASPRYDLNSSDDTCEITPFYSNVGVSLSLYKASGENKEIFGNIGESGFWISIKYQNMETKNLTPQEKSELVLLVDSLVR